MGIEVNIDNEQAKESLKIVNQVNLKTQKAIASSYANPMLILWGFLWIAAYTTSHFYIKYAYIIFTVMGIIGGIGSGIIGNWYRTSAPLKTDSSNSLGKKIFWFWFFLFFYLGIWLAILSPFNGLQLNVVIATAVMFAYVIMGLFFESLFMIALGICVTATTLIGYFVLTPYYCLWMAVTGGGAIFLTGVYIRYKWR